MIQSNTQEVIPGLLFSALGTKKERLCRKHHLAPLLKQTNPSLKAKHTWNLPNPVAFHLSTLCLRVDLSRVPSTP